MSKDLEQRVGNRMRQLLGEPGSVLVAVSGGVDSVALLELLSRSAELHNHKLEVVHVDHGISDESTAVADSVMALAESRGLACHLTRLELGPETSETVARGARRKALREHLEATGADAVVLGHHADDQAETVLMRVLSGSGPAGLAGMAPRRGQWLRPLLNLRRQELEEYLEERGLSAWQDPANQNPKHLRSWLRTVAFPLLEGRVDALSERLNEVAAGAALQRAALNQLPELLGELLLEEGNDSISVAAEVLLGYRSEVQSAVISALGRRLGVRISRSQMERVRSLAETGVSGKRLRLDSGYRAELSFGRLELRRVSEQAPEISVGIAAEETATIGDHWLKATAATASGPEIREGWCATFPPGTYVARPWRPGDRIRPLGGNGSRSVATLFKEAKVASSRRTSWPVVVPSRGVATVMWVPGICRSDGWQPVAGEEALVLECGTS